MVGEIDEPRQARTCGRSGLPAYRARSEGERRHTPAREDGRPVSRASSVAAISSWSPLELAAYGRAMFGGRTVLHTWLSRLTGAACVNEADSDVDISSKRRRMMLGVVSRRTGCVFNAGETTLQLPHLPIRQDRPASRCTVGTRPKVRAFDHRRGR